MSSYSKVTFTHANVVHNDNKPMPLHVVVGTISAWHYSDKSKATHLYTTGGIFPVLETPEQIDLIMKNQPKGDN